MKIKILMLGPAKDLAGAGEIVVEVAEGATVASLRVALVQAAPSLERALPTMRFALNDSFAVDDTPVRAGDEVAVIPPVSGGSNGPCMLVKLVSSVIEPAEVIAFVCGDEHCGAIAAFIGTTRIENDDEHGALVRLDYEAYDRMANTQLHALAEQAMDRWLLARIALVHRIGSVPTGEASVAIAVASGHRAQAFDACRWLIDVLKQNVPIWKKDVFADGFVRWVEPGGQRGNS